MFYHKKVLFVIFSALSMCSVVILSACSTPKTDLRALAPAETMIYLETNDLSEVFQNLTNNQPFQQLSGSSPNFSALKDIQVAVVVTGFETSEKQVTDESAILNFKPRFAVMAETHAWESTAAGLVENQVGQFVKETYGDDVKLEKSNKNGARFYTWTANNGDKIFGSVSHSVIYLGNDETLIDKCLAVKRGENDNLLKNENLARAREKAGSGNLAFGYLTPEAIVQLANLAGVSIAIDASEEGLVRSFIAKVLPNILQKTAKEAVWAARKTEQGIEDKFLIKTEPEVSSIWKETLIVKSNSNFQAAEVVPNEVNSFTRYNLQNPQVAWRSILLTASKSLEAGSGKILNEVSGSFFEPYGITDIETFLSAVGSEIVTVRFDEEGSQSVVVAEIKDVEKLKKSITGEINFRAPASGNLWQSADKTVSAAILENRLILGETESVMKCLQAQTSGQNFTKNRYFPRVANNNAVTVTFAEDSESAEKLVEILGHPKENNQKVKGFYLIETRFDASGMERKTVSDFGLLGTIIEQFAKDN